MIRVINDLKDDIGTSVRSVTDSVVYGERRVVADRELNNEVVEIPVRREVVTLGDPMPRNTTPDIIAIDEVDEDPVIEPEKKELEVVTEKKEEPKVSSGVVIGGKSYSDSFFLTIGATTLLSIITAVVTKQKAATIAAYGLVGLAGGYFAATQLEKKQVI